MLRELTRLNAQLDAALNEFARGDQVAKLMNVSGAMRYTPFRHAREIPFVAPMVNQARAAKKTYRKEWLKQGNEMSLLELKKSARIQNTARKKLKSLRDTWKKMEQGYDRRDGRGQLQGSRGGVPVG
jgi:hypothetical protein